MARKLTQAAMKVLWAIQNRPEMDGLFALERSDRHYPLPAFRREPPWGGEWGQALLTDADYVAVGYYLGFCDWIGLEWSLPRGHIGSVQSAIVAFADAQGHECFWENDERHQLYMRFE